MINIRILIFILLSMLVCLNVFDVVSTHLLLKTGDYFESNPWVNYLIQTFGFWKAMLIAKAPLVFIIFLVLYTAIKQKIGMVVILSLCMVNAIYLYVMATRNLNFLI